MDIINLVANDGTVTDSVLIATDSDVNSLESELESALRNFQTAEMETINSSEILAKIDAVNDNFEVANTCLVLILAFCLALSTFIMIKK